MLSPVPQILLKGLEHLPGLDPEALAECGPDSDAHSATRCSDPKVCQLRDRTLGGVTLGRWQPPKAGATCGRGARVGPRDPGWLQWGPCAAPSDAPSSGHCPCGGSCSSGNCSHPGPGSGYSPPPPASRARRENLPQVCSEYFPPVRKTALRPASFPAFPPLNRNQDSPVSLSPGTLLGGEDSVWDRFYSLAGIR